MTPPDCATRKHSSSSSTGYRPAHQRQVLLLLSQPYSILGLSFQLVGHVLFTLTSRGVYTDVTAYLVSLVMMDLQTAAGVEFCFLVDTALSVEVILMS